MKTGIVIKINKDHCIALTPDGSFIKKPIEPGTLEIGDEITIEEKRSFSKSTWFKSLAIAASVVIVIGLGSWGISRILGSTATVADMEIASGEPVGQEEKAMMLQEEAPAEEPIQAIKEDEDFAYKIQGIEGFPSGEGEISRSFELELNDELDSFEVIAGNLLFSYWIDHDQQEKNIIIAIEPLEQDLGFSGIIYLTLLDTEGMSVTSRELDLESFTRGETVNESIPLDENTGRLNIFIDGVFSY